MEMTYKELVSKFDTWCLKYQREPMDIDLIDDSYVLITFQKNTYLYRAEMLDLLHMFDYIEFHAYSSYVEIRIDLKP